VSSDVSGAFAYTYILPFFLALTVGIIALKRGDDLAIREFQNSKEELD